MSLNTTIKETIQILNEFNRTEHHEFRDSTIRPRIIMRGIGGFTSVLSSIILVFMLRRSKKGFSSMSNRLLLGMGISDILYSLPFILFNIYSPLENDYISWNAKGNLTTTTIVYGLHSLGMCCGWGYIASLNAHYFMLVKFEKNRSIQRKAEPYLHLIPIILSVIITALYFLTESLNDVGGYWYGSNSKLPHCAKNITFNKDEFDIPCNRGISYILYLSLAHLILCFVAIFIFLGLMYHKLRTQEKRNAKYGLRALRKARSSMKDSKNERRGCRGCLKSPFLFMSLYCTEMKNYKNTRPKKSHSQAVVERAQMYTLVFFLAWFPLIIMSFLDSNFESAGFQFFVSIFSVLNPLEGFFNLCIFMCPKVKAARKKENGEKISWGRAIIEAFASKKKNTKPKQPKKVAKQEVLPTDEAMTETGCTPKKIPTSSDVISGNPCEEEEKNEACDVESLEPPPLRHNARNNIVCAGKFTEQSIEIGEL